jgi:Flp pilus assembly protein TadD
LGGDGSEVDWFVGYYPPPENFQASLEKILKGENTYKVLQQAYAKNPKDAAAVFGLARKWDDRYDPAKATEKYKEVVALDPEGKAGSYTDPETQITAPYTEYAKYSLAMAASRGPKPDMAPVRAFIAENPKSLLARQAYRSGSYFYGRQPKEEAEKFFAEYTAAYPDDPEALASWLRRIIRDKGPMDKGAELVAKLRGLTNSDPSPSINLAIAQFYDLAGDKAKAEEVYGEAFMANRLETGAYNLIAYATYWADKKENLPGAQAAAELALKLQPDSIQIVRSVATVYVKAGEDAKALDLYGPAWLEKKVSEKADQDLYSYAAFWTRQGKNLESALAAAEKAVEIEPKAYFYWSILSDVYAKMGDKAAAIKALEKSVELASGNAKAGMQKKLDGLKGPEAKK